MKTRFLLQTSKDYDMKYSEVEHIYEKWGLKLLYEKLEEFIKERANN